MFKKFNKFLNKTLQELDPNHPQNPSQNQNSPECLRPGSVEIPLSGNAYITQKVKGAPEVITDYGLGNWIRPDTICSIFFRLCQPGAFSLSLRLSVPEGRSKIRVFITPSPMCHQGQEVQVDISGSEPHIVYIGQFSHTCEGYIKINLQGLDREFGYFADVSHAIVDTQVHHVLQDFDHHFGRRGPSVHMGYVIPPQKMEKIDFFYNEIFVPQYQDIKGSYYCAIGFNGGYLGIQVNSSVERRVLFSIWSDYETDDPAKIPEKFKIKLLRKGDQVNVGEFGNEGSGGQSFLRYNWYTGQTYKFLLSGTPDPNSNTTVYTAWFASPENNYNWILIASFQKPQKSEFLSGFYSFSENFKPKKGHLERTVLFTNQWAHNYGDGDHWHEITEANFTGDDTSKNCRKDFAGGVHSQQPNCFYLKNCGFFDDFICTNQKFNRCPTGLRPDVNFLNLP